MSDISTRKIKCLIIDDEEPAHEVLKFLIAKVPWLAFEGSCYNGIEAIEVVPARKPDIIFLDVNMPELSGLDLLNIIQSPELHVIMTTAYPEYAVDGFTFDVTAFLLKPIGFDRFLKAVTKVRKLITGGQIPEPTSALSEMKPESPANDEYVWIRADRKMYCVWFKDIFLIEGLKDYVKVHYTGGVLVTLMSMSAMMEKLPFPPFVRTHRSYIVNRNAIRMIEGNTITLQNGKEVAIAVSSTRDEIFRQLTAK
ncbi:LytTR family DNA-binding domain-containing protein [Dyadobacter sp. CY327]|uniref:LytR/AlgR family response regulator transcription factor n=1 Tax=Dyadobacter sp. CY327 TaxID=2907301 RepID=UPI001F3C265D|nr:LytTR family DNA-binding domain-containing protein [Dyadobacter sp. CY327]MCE7069048.1 LytTR family DNA-binding domain-containing protein [Dyadobacter sp. CY327]